MRVHHTDLVGFQQNQTDSPLLGLPAELRNIIWATVLDTIVLHRVSGRLREHHVVADNLAPLLTCRQIYHEAWAIYPATLRLSGNQDHPDIDEVRDIFGKSHCAALKTIEIPENFITRWRNRRQRHLQLTSLWDVEEVRRLFIGVQRVVVIPKNLLSESEENKQTNFMRESLGKTDL